MFTEQQEKLQLQNSCAREVFRLKQALEKEESERKEAWRQVHEMQQKAMRA